MSQELDQTNTRLLGKLQETHDLWSIRSDLEEISEEWNQSNKRLQAVFQSTFPNTWDDDKTAEVTTLTKAYHKYKKEYVKHLSFDREEGNLSKYLFGDVH